MMDLTMLRQFAVVARLEHLSRAADELHVAQPSLSRTIACLCCHDPALQNPRIQ